MSAKIRYSSHPIGDPKVIRDFLPPPGELAFREEDVKITITLSRRSVAFFKREAAARDTGYQRMIRGLIDAYVDAYASPDVSRPSAPRARPRAKAKTP